MTKKDAQEGVLYLLSLMEDKGWESRVWENLGWHYSINKAGMTIYTAHTTPGEVQKYHSLFTRSQTHKGYGDVFWEDINSNINPNKLVKEQVRVVKEYIEQFNKECEIALKGLTNENP